MALLRHRKVISLGPVTGANRKRNAQAEFSQFGPICDMGGSRLSQRKSIVCSFAKA